LTIGGWDITDTSIEKINTDGTGIIISSTGYIKSAEYTSGSAGWTLNADGFAEFNNVTVRGELISTTGSIGGWDITDTSISKIGVDDSGIIISSTGYIQSANYSSGVQGWNLMNDGTAEFNDVTVRGHIEASSGQIGGWNITESTIENVSGDNGIIINSAGYIESADYINGTHGWRLAEDGTAEFRDVWVRGHIEADTGYIGDWDISDGKLVSGAMTLDADTKQITVEGTSQTVKFGYNVTSGQHGLYIDASNYFVWDDNVSQGKFRVGTTSEYLLFDGTNVSISGNVSASSGTIGGWLISDNTISAGGITLDAINGTIYANDFQFKEGSVVIGDTGGSYLAWDGTNLTVLGNLQVSAGDKVIRFIDSEIELHDFQGQRFLDGLSIAGYYGIEYRCNDTTIDLSTEDVSTAYWRHDDTDAGGNPIDYRRFYWEVTNKEYDASDNLLNGGHIQGYVIRPVPGYSAEIFTHLELYTKSNGTDSSWRYMEVRTGYITDFWQTKYNDDVVTGRIRFSSIQNYPDVGSNPTYPATGVFVFEYAPINVLVSSPTTYYPAGTIFVYGDYLYYKDNNGIWRRILGEQTTIS